MGKKIDLFVLTAGITAIFYLFISDGFEGKVLPLLISLLFCIILNRIIRFIRRTIVESNAYKRKCIRKNCAGIMMHIACMDEEEAKRKLKKLVQRAYDSDDEVMLIQSNPSSGLRDSDIFDVWKRSRGKERIIICATSHSDVSCRTLAESLEHPKIALLDAGALMHLIARYPFEIGGRCSGKQKKEKRWLRMKYIFLNRKNAPRCLLMFLSLMLIYLMTANIYYLISSVSLLMIALLSLQRQKSPAKLF